MEAKIPFSIRIVDIFHFKGGVTLFVGELDRNVPISFPRQVSLLVDGQIYQNIRLQGQRMPGNHLPANYVAVYTNASVDLDKQLLQDRECLLVSEIDSQQ